MRTDFDTLYQQITSIAYLYDISLPGDDGPSTVVFGEEDRERMGDVEYVLHELAHLAILHVLKPVPTRAFNIDSLIAAGYRSEPDPFAAAVAQEIRTQAVVVTCLKAYDLPYNHDALVELCAKNQFISSMAADERRVRLENIMATSGVRVVGLAPQPGDLFNRALFNYIHDTIEAEEKDFFVQQFANELMELVSQQEYSVCPE